MHHHHLLLALIPPSWCWLSEDKHNNTEQFQHGRSSSNILNTEKKTKQKQEGEKREKKKNLLSALQLFAREYTLIHKTRSQNHRIVWVERDLKAHLAPAPCHEQGHVPPAQVHMAHMCSATLKYGLGSDIDDFTDGTELPACLWVRPVPVPHRLQKASAMAGRTLLLGACQPNQKELCEGTWFWEEQNLLHSNTTQLSFSSLQYISIPK